MPDPFLLSPEAPELVFIFLGNFSEAKPFFRKIAPLANLRPCTDFDAPVLNFEKKKGSQRVFFLIDRRMPNRMSMELAGLAHVVWPQKGVS